MMKTKLKQTLVFLSCAMTLVLLVDHLHYTIKTEHLSDYAVKEIAENSPPETDVELLESKSLGNIEVLLLRSTLGMDTHLYALAYQKSPLSQAYQLVHKYDTTPTDGKGIDKSFIVKNYSTKVMVLFGEASLYNVQVIRNRLVSDYFETKDQDHYLIMLDDIDHLYFYYESPK